VVCPGEEDLLGFVELVDRTGVCLGELHSVGHNRREHRFEVQVSAYCLTDFGESLQILDRTCEIAGTRLQLLEQLYVLDGDQRLIGEGLQELDLRVGESFC